MRTQQIAIQRPEWNERDENMGYEYHWELVFLSSMTSKKYMNQQSCLPLEQGLKYSIILHSEFLCSSNNGDEIFLPSPLDAWGNQLKLGAGK